MQLLYNTVQPKTSLNSAEETPKKCVTGLVYQWMCGVTFFDILIIVMPNTAPQQNTAKLCTVLNSPWQYNNANPDYQYTNQKNTAQIQFTLFIFF